MNLRQKEIVRIGIYGSLRSILNGGDFATGELILLTRRLSRTATEWLGTSRVSSAKNTQWPRRRSLRDDHHEDRRRNHHRHERDSCNGDDYDEWDHFGHEVDLRIGSALGSVFFITITERSAT